MSNPLKNEDCEDARKFVDAVLIIDIERDTRDLKEGEDECFTLKSQWGTYYCKGYEKGIELFNKALALRPNKFNPQCELIERFDPKEQKKVPTIEINIKDERGMTIRRNIYAIPLDKAKREGNKCIVPLEDKSNIFCKGMEQGINEIADISGIDYGSDINKTLYTSNCGIMADTSKKEEKAKILAGIRRSKRNLWS